MSFSGIKIKTFKDIDQVKKNLMLLTDVEVLVGFPEDTSARTVDTGETLDSGKAHMGVEGSDLTNATLAYIHDNGAPEAHIPARPFMLPGIADVQDRLTSKMGQVMKGVVTRGEGALFIEMGMHQMGLIAKLGIQNKINEGVPPPLADSTLRARARKGRKGAGIELLSRSLGIAPSMDFAKPLIDTGQLRNATNYVIRSRKKRT